MFHRKNTETGVAKVTLFLALGVLGLLAIVLFNEFAGKGLQIAQKKTKSKSVFECDEIWSFVGSKKNEFGFGLR